MAGVDLADRPDLDRVVRLFQRQLEQDYAPPHMKRDAHPKMHGCVQAYLTIHEDRYLPEDLRSGVFANPGKEYRAWVRFSNAFGIQHDLEFESRGMAIKVLDVKGGERLLDDQAPPESEGDTQDFLMATFDAFVLPNTKDYDYVEFACAARQSGAALLRVFLKHRLWRGLWALFGTGLVLARNPLAIPYFSQTPYRLGPLNVKLRARPLWTAALVRSVPSLAPFAAKAAAANVVLNLSDVGGRGPLRFFGLKGTKEAAEAFCDRYIGPRNFLRHAMSAFLADHSANFEIAVQIQDPNRERSMPLDNATVRWSQRRSPFRPVAILHIPRQVFWPAPGMPPAIERATIDMMHLGEHLSFNPWHGLAAHRPLGDINDARRRIYREMSVFRRGKNAAHAPDPLAEWLRLASIVQR